MWVLAPGYLLNTIDFSISLKPGNPDKVITRVKLLLEYDRPPLRLLQQVAGDMSWSSKVLPGSLALANPLHCIITLLVDKDWISFPSQIPVLRPLHLKHDRCLQEFLSLLGSGYNHRINHLKKTHGFLMRRGFRV